MTAIGEIIKNLNSAAQKKIQTKPSGMHYQADDDIRKMLTALNLDDIPIPVAKNYYDLLVGAKNSADKCRFCQKEQDKIMSCSVSRVVFDSLTQAVYLIAAG